jgi:hypothetical protein
LIDDRLWESNAARISDSDQASLHGDYNVITWDRSAQAGATSAAKPQQE